MKGIVSKGETALRTINWILIIFFCFLFLLPFWLVLMSSVTDEMTFVINGYVLVPKKFSLEGFKFIFGASDLILGSIKNSVIISLTATALTVVIVTMTAYVLSKKYLPGVKWLSLLFVVTMFFSGGTIPSYLVIRSIGLYDTIWALIIPSIGNMFYIVLMRSYFYSLPAALEEAAVIDGASNMQILLRIFVPLSLPMVATIGFFTFVDRWNSWMDALIYLGPSSQKLWPVQYVIKRLLEDMQGLLGSSIGSLSEAPAQTAKSAGVIITVAPLVVIFPIVHRFFVGGITVGAVKG
ncbi:MAG: carbohydrate ABC transporter permease [Eubacteriales bacterium]